MKDKDKPYFSFTPSQKSSFWMDSFISELYEKRKNNPVYLGIDWCAGNGMIRGEIIKKEGNVTHVRFKTVTV